MIDYHIEKYYSVELLPFEHRLKKFGDYPMIAGKGSHTNIHKLESRSKLVLRVSKGYLLYLNYGNEKPAR